MHRLLLLVLLTGSQCFAQIPQLVQDIDTGTSASDPQRLAVFNGKLYFTATNSMFGRELWEWHAMSTPAARITDLYTGAGDGTPAGTGDITMHAFKGKLYFCGATVNSTKLMAYDGTNPPMTIRSSSTASGPNWMTHYGSRFYYVDDSSSFLTASLYSYAGAGTTALISTFGLVARNALNQIIPFKGKIYFNYGGPPAGSELGAFDTLTGQMGMVADLAPGSSLPFNFVVLGDKLYFSARDSVKGIELFLWDGGTARVLTDIQSGSADGLSFIGSDVMTVAAFNGAIYFSGLAGSNHHALYKYDTATKLATMVYDPQPGTSSTGALIGLYGTLNNLYFYYNHPTSGLELYKYDGTSGKLIADLNPGSGAGVGLSNIVQYGSYIYFNGNNGTTNYELYRLYDGEKTGVENTSWEGSLKVFPNPATNTLTLRLSYNLPLKAEFSLIDGSGREVFTTGQRDYAAGTSDLAISLKLLASGQYFYRLQAVGKTLASGSLMKD
jgi:ELWxxDGT repeat protein